MVYVRMCDACLYVHRLLYSYVHVSTAARDAARPRVRDALRNYRGEERGGIGDVTCHAINCSRIMFFNRIQSSNSVYRPLTLESFV